MNLASELDCLSCQWLLLSKKKKSPDQISPFPPELKSEDSHRKHTGLSFVPSLLLDFKISSSLLCYCKKGNLTEGGTLSETKEKSINTQNVSSLHSLCRSSSSSSWKTSTPCSSGRSFGCARLFFRQRGLPVMSSFLSMVVSSNTIIESMRHYLDHLSSPPSLREDRLSDLRWSLSFSSMISLPFALHILLAKQQDMSHWLSVYTRFIYANVICDILLHPLILIQYESQQVFLSCTRLCHGYRPSEKSSSLVHHVMFALYSLFPEQSYCYW